jgi:hypothetical protein
MGKAFVFWAQPSFSSWPQNPYLCIIPAEMTGKKFWQGNCIWTGTVFVN